MILEREIEAMLARSVVRMQTFYETAWIHDSILCIKDHEKLSVSIKQEGNLIVQISTGCVANLEQLQAISMVVFTMDHALDWLILHEIQHAELGHFGLLKRRPVLHLVSRSGIIAYPQNGIPKPLWHKVAPCIELQADHDAIELMLGNYSIWEWEELRAKIASISAVMILIAKTDDDNAIEHSTHPKAATRIFQLLGHVTEMWSLPAHAKAKARNETVICKDDLPSDEEKQLFSKEVILPAFWDAVALAEVAEAKSIISDLGSPEDIFADIARAKLGHWDELVTVGAKEWAKLKNANNLILPLLQKFQSQN